MFAGICMFVLPLKKMKIAAKIPYIIVAGFAWIVIISSCANQGMPTGGPKDSIPPVLVETHPDYRALNFNGDEVRLTFNEYIIPDEVREKLVVSPPLKKRPTIRTKSKTLIVQFNEDLKDSTTYSLDFKNSVADNNERNEYENLRFSFSTGDVYDSLRVAGRVLEAFNLEPKENVLVMLHSNLHDSAVYTVIPDYIAKTNETGLFLMDNISPGTYHIFSVTDNNNNLLYDEGAEEIAFLDSVIVPGAEYREVQDTLVKGVDSMLVTGHTQFFPDPVYLRQFTEDIFDQYIVDYERNNPYQSTIVFNEPVADSFNIRLLNHDIENWYILEHNPEMDSLTIWLSDTTLVKTDTLVTEVSYFQLDTLSQLFVQKDTLEFIGSFTGNEEESSKRRRRDKGEESEPESIPQFTLKTNLGTAPFDLNKDIRIKVPEPVKSFDSTQVSLYLKEDTLKTPLQFNFSKDTAAWRTYSVSYAWEPGLEYSLEIDSAAVENVYGITSKQLKKDFEMREEDYYGKIILNMQDVEMPVIVQLLENTEDEKVISQKYIDENATVAFDFLAPDKYKLKAVYDRNGNRKWDPGSYQDHYLPERVTYINEVIKIRGNWDSKFDWQLTPDPHFSKKIRDKELEEQHRKDAREKARQERNERPQLQNQNQTGTGASGILRR